MFKNTIITIILANIVLLGAQLWITTSRATEGQRIHDLEVKTSEFITQNNELKSKIYSASSIRSIQDRAEKANLVLLKVVTLNPPPVAASRP